MGLPEAPCTNTAWSTDGKWIYLNLHTEDNSMFGAIVSGVAESSRSPPALLKKEGIALSPDGQYLITSVGLRQRIVSVNSASGDRRISLEGYAYSPSFSPDGKKLYYRVLKGATSPALGASELWVTVLNLDGMNRSFLASL